MGDNIRIDEVCEVYDGPHATPTKTTCGPIYLGIDAITDNGKLNPIEFSHLSEDDYKIWTKRVTPQKNDIVFSYEATLGRYALIPEGFYGCLGRRLAIVRPKDERINPFWLYYYFLSPEWSVFIKNHTVKGSTVNRISVDDFPSYHIPNVKRENQDKIVSVLKAIDDRIDNNGAICKLLESMAKTLYDYWFTQFDFPNAEGKPYRASGGEMVWNDQLKREIPKDWEVRKLKEIISVNGTAIQSADEYPNLPYTPIDYLPKKTMSFAGGESSESANSSLQIYEENNILLGAMRVYFHRVCIAAQRGITRSTTMVLKPHDSNSLPYAYQILNMDSTITYANKVSVGTQQPYVNWDDALDSFLFPYPSDESLIQKYCEIVWPIVNKVKALCIENNELTRLRDWLLPMLMNGQATVE